MSDSEEEHCTAACCANHICAKQMDLATDVHVACALCLSSVYCSEACRQMDWITHDCPNAKMMDAPGKLVAVPYAYQDEAPAEVIAEELENPRSPLRESYQLAHMGQDMVMTSWSLASVGETARPYNVKPSLRGDLGRGSVPPDDLKPHNYTIIVSDGSHSVAFSGNVGIHSIWLGNKQNSRANKIAQANRLDKSTGTLLLWPDHNQTTEDRMFKNTGDMSVELRINGKEPLSIEFELLPIKTSFFARMGRKALKHFQMRLRLKFDASSKNKESNIKNMYVVRAKTPRGLQVNLVFIALPSQKGLVELADVEFAVPLNQIRATSSLSTQRTEEFKRAVSDLDLKAAAFRCDPRSVAQMVGLSMALDRTIAKNTAAGTLEQIKRIQNAAGIVRKQTRLLLDGPSSSEVPMEVSTAVHSAVNFLHDDLCRS